MHKVELTFLTLICTLIVSQSWAYDLTFSCHHFEPYVTVDDKQEPQGVFVDIVHEACARVGFTYDIQLLSNRRSKAVLKTGQVNGNFPLGWNKQRDQWLYWTPPLMTVEYGIFVNSQVTRPPKTIEDLQGQTVGVFGPSNTSHSLEKINASIKAANLKPLRIDMVPNEDGSNMKKLNLKRLDAVYINKDVGFYYVKKFQLKNIQYAISHRKLLYYIGFAKEHNQKEVIAKFNKGIREVEEEGVLLYILKKWGLAPPIKDGNIR
jgi:polar amino acid transport system substrate-binding protein